MSTVKWTQWLIKKKFFAWLEKNLSQCFNKCMEITSCFGCIFDRHKRFKKRPEKVKDDLRSGRHSTNKTAVNIKRVKQVVCADCHLTVQMITSQLDMKKNSLREIITEDLGMWKVCAKMVPRLLNDDQKDPRKQVYQNIIKRLPSEPDLLSFVITCDETWMFEYNLETKCHCSLWKSPKSQSLKKAKQKSKSHSSM